MSSLLLFLFGLTLLLTSSRGVIKNAILISQLTKLPPFIIGVTIVAIGTSLPEMIISLFGGLEKTSGLALGNIIGSNIANTSLILGIALLVHPLYIGKTKTQKNNIIAVVISVILFLTLLIDGISILHGFIFVILGAGIIVWQIIQGRHDGFIDPQPSQPTKHPFLAIFYFLLSLGGLLVGGKLLVDAGVDIAKFFNVPEVIIGITAVALGTSLPELSVSIVALSKKVTHNEQKLVIGNILGSNIFNILFGSGMLGLFGVRHFTNPFSLYAFLFFTLVLSFLIYFFRGKSIPKYWGVLLILSYIIYISLLFLVA